MPFFSFQLYLQGVQHVVCPSTGNAGVAAAVVAQTLSIACTVVTPESDVFTRSRLSVEAPLAKHITYGLSFADAVEKAEQIVNQENQSFGVIGEPIHTRLVNPYELADYSFGYFTLIDELSSIPDLIILPVGGGILVTGVIQRMWTHGWTNTYILAVEPEGREGLGSKLLRARSLPSSTSRSFSVLSSLFVAPVSEKVVALCDCQHLSVAHCSDAEAVEASKRFLDEHGMLLDPVSASALTPIYNGTVAKLQCDGFIPKYAKICVIITGGRNISIQRLNELEKHVKSNQISDSGPRGYPFSQSQPSFNAQSVLASLDSEMDNAMGSETAVSSGESNSENKPPDSMRECH